MGLLLDKHKPGDLHLKVKHCHWFVAGQTQTPRSTLSSQWHAGFLWAPKTSTHLDVLGSCEQLLIQCSHIVKLLLLHLKVDESFPQDFRHVQLRLVHCQAEDSPRPFNVAQNRLQFCILHTDEQQHMWEKKSNRWRNKTHFNNTVYSALFLWLLWPSA